MSISKIILALVALCASFITSSGQQTRVLTADKSNEYGLVYTLPVTALRVELTARCDVERRGPFYQYARKYLGNVAVVVEDAERWVLTAADAMPYGTAVKETQYVMQFKPGSIGSVCVADNGMLLAINAETEAPVTPSTVMSAKREATAHIDPANEYLKYVGEDFLASQSTAKQAQLLAEALMEVRDSRIALTRGTADTMPSDGKQLELMLNSLQQQEEALTAAFTGVKWSETSSKGFNVIPEEEGETLLCRFSSFSGFTDADDLSGAPVRLSITDISEPEMPVDAKGEPKKLPKDAVIYNIPGSAKVSVTDSKKTLFSADYRFAQFGIQFGLAPSLFSDRREPYFAIFNPVTGSLVEVSAIDRPAEK